MTANRAFKRQVRERASRTGESDTTALRHVLAANDAAASADTPAPAAARLRLAVAQTTRRVDPLNPEAFRAASNEVQSLMHRAHDEGADLVLFCEATLCFPDKQALSTDPEAVTDADWSRFPWDALDAEITRIRATS